MADVLRVGGNLEPARRPTGRRVLLPAEAELCNVVGITEAEYWEFVEKIEAYNGKRPEGYELIPDVRNDPVVTSVIVNLVIGLTLSAAAALLAPKPSKNSSKEIVLATYRPKASQVVSGLRRPATLIQFKT